MPIYRTPCLVFSISLASASHQLLMHIHKMELTKFEILNHYWKQDYKAAAAARRICEAKDKVSLVSVWHNNGFVSKLENKILKTYHVLEDLNYGILRIYAEFWGKNP